MLIGAILSTFSALMLAEGDAFALFLQIRNLVAGVKTDSIE